MDATITEPVQETTPAATTEPNSGAAATTTTEPAAGAATTESAGDNPFLLEIDTDGAQSGDGSTQTAEPGEALKPYLELSPYINSPEALQGAVQDSHLLWDVINGQVPAGKILAGLETSNPQAWQNIVNGLAQYISEKTGFQFVDPKNAPQSQPDPVQARIDAIEQQFRTQQEERESQLLTQRAVQSQRVLLNHLGEALKGSFLEGEEASVLSQLGQKIGDPIKAIEAIEKGDFKSIESALKAVKKDEAERYNRYAKRIAAQRKGVANALPKVDNPGSVATRKGTFDLSTREGRIAAMNAAV